MKQLNPEKMTSWGRELPLIGFKYSHIQKEKGKESGGEEKEELLRGGKGNGRVEGRGMRKKRFPHAVSLWGKRSLRESA